MPTLPFIHPTLRNGAIVDLMPIETCLLLPLPETPAIIRTDCLLFSHFPNSPPFAPSATLELGEASFLTYCSHCRQYIWSKAHTRTVSIRTDERKMEVGFEKFRQLLKRLGVHGQRVEKVQPLVKFHHLVLQESACQVSGGIRERTLLTSAYEVNSFHHFSKIAFHRSTTSFSNLPRRWILAYFSANSVKSSHVSVPSWFWSWKESVQCGCCTNGNSDVGLG